MVTVPSSYNGRIREIECWIIEVSDKRGLIHCTVERLLKHSRITLSKLYTLSLGKYCITELRSTYPHGDIHTKVYILEIIIIIKNCKY